MIFTNKENINRYLGINENLDKAINFIMNTDLSSLKDGRTDIDGDKVFVNIATNDLKEKSNMAYEGHRKYIDIQYIIDSSEAIYSLNVQDISGSEKLKGDFQVFYADEYSCESILKKDDLIILFPEDIHAPGVKAFNSKAKKAVFKVLCS